MDLVFSQLVEVRRDLSEQKCKCLFNPDLKMSPEPASRMHGANCSSERGGVFENTGRREICKIMNAMM